MMLKKAMVTAALLLSAAGSTAAWAKEKEMQGGAKEIQGTVIGSSAKDLYVRSSEGAAVPIRVTHETMMDGQKLKKDQRIESHLKKEFKPGEEVRANIEVKSEKGKAENIALELSKQQ